MSELIDITNLIERIEPMEDRLSLTLEGLYADYQEFGDSSYINVNGELHSTNGLELEDDIFLVLTVYDSQGRVINTTDQYFSANSFHMFETFSATLDTKLIKPSKIRLHPKKS
jgi:hypothetical protein